MIHLFDGQKRLSSSRRLRLLGSLLLVILMTTTLGTLARFSKEREVRAAGSSFTFTAAGDYGQTSNTSANLAYIGKSGSKFHLALGDLNYDYPTVTPSQWSSYVTSYLPANFPFEILVGEHDSADIDALAADLPDHLGNITGTYAKEYYFDYPPTAPLARFLLVSPGLGYTYAKGSTDYNWVSSVIDNARAAGIRWIIVGMHDFCIAISSGYTQSCTGQDLINLLLSKKVDLVLQGQDHSYQASKQLALNTTTCTTLNVASYNPSCVVSSSTSLTQGAGTTIVITATGGKSFSNVYTSDPETGYFRAWMGANANPTWGVSQVTVSPTQLNFQFVPTSGGNFTDHFTITGNGSPPPLPSSSPTGTPSSGSGPLSPTWYFAEGRVGKGFREYLTIANPAASACAVNIEYLYTLDGSSTPANKTISVNIPPASRLTQSVNSDLGLVDSSTSAASLAAIVNVDTQTTPGCAGVVVERPMYFSNFHGISSGTDVLGRTTLSTIASFADVPTGSNYTSYLTVLNPNTAPAHVTATYYANGSAVQSQTLTVPATARGTISPGLLGMPQHVAAVVTSDQPIMVERPTYFVNVSGVSGAYDVVGVAQPASDWLFAEGYTGPGYQEYLTLANLDPSKTVSVTITLKSGTGATNATTLALGPESQSIWNVNSANIFSGATPEVSAEVTAASSISGVAVAVRKTPTPGTATPTVTPIPTSSGAGIVVQRELYFTYKHTLPQATIGGTDVMGQIGPATYSAYSFAEGYTNIGYNEWLTLQNPTTKDETVLATIVNGNAKSSSQSFVVRANSRFTVDVTALVQQVFSPGTNSTGNSISMTVHTLDGSVFVAERPMYWNTSGVSPFITRGGSDIIGFVGA